MARPRARRIDRLAAQCLPYALAIETVVASPAAGRMWLDAHGELRRPELIALDHFTTQGHLGSWCEGGTLLLTIKAAALPALIRRNTFRSRQDARTRYLEAQCVLLADYQEEILEEIRGATDGGVAAAATEILSEPFIQQYFPRVRAENITALWRALGRSLVTDISCTFFRAPYDFRAGWPDLTLIRGNNVRFVEVKTTDLLHPSQCRIIDAFAKPFSLMFSIARVQAKEALTGDR